MYHCSFISKEVRNRQTSSFVFSNNTHQLEITSFMIVKVSVVLKMCIKQKASLLNSVHFSQLFPPSRRF